ncbi:MAG: tRNA (adenosine(37)-N6)-threonylcarbamoyltransferase complex dimerization subunit type 1 TsaB [Planctomycetota bacterium]|nr:tRNA (adenosine(37)-N6)-threonylcarbamoyltransferase complex dimerization subunit type 1 TsaB [Planctomycetota bacterium]
MTRVILGLSASMGDGAVVLLRGKEILHSGRIGPRGEHNRNLVVVAKKALECNSLCLSDVDTFAADVGPGSYTGIRLALSAVRTIGWLKSAKLLPVVSMDVLAISALAQLEGDRTFAIVLDARRDAMYRCVYEPTGSVPRRVHRPVLFATDNVAEGLSLNSVIVGSVAAECPAFENFNVLPVTPEYESDALAQLLSNSEAETVNWQKLQPLYLRKTSAEEFWDSRQEKK